ncbi:YncE family protein [Deinococcus misasensis]|uniref:YncE family protein n=1 Tax=Deinococcus misasensis TaxID=392413 RepID=UPI000552DB5A|nr:WD40 repeat domain-containing protein [Deinococcus misasensis]
MENNPIDKLNANDVFIYKDHLFAQVKNTLYSLQIQITPEREVVWGEVKKISGPADLPDRAKGDPNNVNTKDMHRFPDWFTAQSPSGKLLYVNQSGSAVVFVFDLEHQKFLRTLKLKQEIEHLTVSDRYLVGHVYNDGEDNVRVYDLQGKEVKLIRKVCPRNIRGRITFLSGDGKHLVAQCSGYTFTEGKEYAGLQVFRTGTWDRVGEVVLPFETASQVVLSEDGKRVLFVDLEGKLQVWDLLASLRRVK